MASQPPHANSNYKSLISRFPSKFYATLKINDTFYPHQKSSSRRSATAAAVAFRWFCKSLVLYMTWNHYIIYQTPRAICNRRKGAMHITIRFFVGKWRILCSLRRAWWMRRKNEKRLWRRNCVPKNWNSRPPRGGLPRRPRKITARNCAPGTAFLSRRKLFFNWRRN